MAEIRLSIPLSDELAERREEPIVGEIIDASREFIAANSVFLSHELLAHLQQRFPLEGSTEQLGRFVGEVVDMCSKVEAIHGILRIERTRIAWGNSDRAGYAVIFEKTRTEFDDLTDEELDVLVQQEVASLFVSGQVRRRELLVFYLKRTYGYDEKGSNEVLSLLVREGVLAERTYFGVKRYSLAGANVDLRYDGGVAPSVTEAPKVEPAPEVVEEAEDETPEDAEEETTLELVDDTDETLVANEDGEEADAEVEETAEEAEPYEAEAVEEAKEEPALGLQPVEADEAAQEPALEEVVFEPEIEVEITLPPPPPQLPPASTPPESAAEPRVPGRVVGGSRPKRAAPTPEGVKRDESFNFIETRLAAEVLWLLSAPTAIEHGVSVGDVVRLIAGLHTSPQIIQGIVGRMWRRGLLHRDDHNNLRLSDLAYRDARSFEASVRQMTASLTFARELRPSDKPPGPARLAKPQPQ